jgi:hypothetical protein
MTPTAADLLGALDADGDPIAHPQKHYRGLGGVLGVRMGDLFRIAEQHAGMPLSHVSRLLDEPQYEPRMAAFCILDFQVRAPEMTDDDRRDRYDLYLTRHDAIDAWDMVDRAAPRVIGGYLSDRPRDVLVELAMASDPLRRRTAITAPLFYTRPRHPDGLLDLYRIAELLLEDPDPIVAKPVGIALKHAGGVDPDGVREFIARNGERMSASLLREARSKLTG